MSILKIGAVIFQFYHLFFFVKKDYIIEKNYGSVKFNMLNVSVNNCESILCFIMKSLTMLLIGL